MSTVLSISFIPKEKSNYPEIYQRLSDWVRECSENFSLKEILDSADYTSYTIESVKPVEILNSNKAVANDFFLTKYKPFEIRGYLWLYGEKYNGGYPSKSNGAINISLDERDIWGIYRWQYIENKEYEKAREHEISVLFEISELFNDLTLICEDLIQYASFYTESGISTPFTSSMIYHKNYRELINDFMRIYIESRTELNLLEFFGAEIDSLESAGKITNTHYKSFEDESRGNLLAFLETIDLQVINSLRSIKEIDIERMLTKVLKNNNDIIFTKTNSGFILSTYPLVSLWPLYYDLLRELKNIN